MHVALVRKLPNKLTIATVMFYNKNIMVTNQHEMFRHHDVVKELNEELILSSGNGGSV